MPLRMEPKSLARSGVGHVVDRHAPDRADACALRTAQARAEPQEDRRAGDVVHGEVAHGHVLDHPAVHALDSQPVAVVKHTVADNDVPEPARRFRAELDAPRARHAVLAGEVLPGAVEHGAFQVVPADATAGDGHVLGVARMPQAVAGLQADAVVPRGIDGAVGDVHVAASIDIDAVAVRVDLEVVNGEVIDACGQDAEVPAVQDGKVAQRHVAAVLQGDSLVANTVRGDFARVGIAEFRRRHGAGAGEDCGRLIAQPLVSPRPWIRPGPVMATFSRSSPQRRLLGQ